jgi:hypothetical protein
LVELGKYMKGSFAIKANTANNNKGEQEFGFGRKTGVCKGIL